MKDARDSQKVASLPDDLRSIAEGMLEDKFGLPKKGEVQEKPKKAKTSHGKRQQKSAWDMISDTNNPMQLFTTTSTATSTTLTFEDVQRAVDSMRRQSGEYGLSPAQWVRMAEEGYERGTFPYIPEGRCFELQLESPYTRRKYTHRFGREQLLGFNATDGGAYYVAKVLERVSREYMEPFVIVDPNKSRPYYDRYVSYEPFF